MLIGELIIALRATVVVSLILLCLLMGAQAQQEPEAPVETAPVPPDYSAYPSVPGELRGVWMHNCAEPSWPEAAQTLAGANFNAVFPYVMSGGVAFYCSKVLPVHAKVAEEGDFLDQAVRACKAAGVPVHARMLNLTTLFASKETVARLTVERRLMRTSKGKTEPWLCPTNQTNRKQQVASALEMAAYGVDGIQFDYLRYPWKTSCFCGTCRRKFEADLRVKARTWPLDAQTGCYRGRFANWRREQITSLVADVSRAVRQADPGILVSAAVFLNGSGNLMGRRCHIIYAHPAGTDGYSFFYLYYYPGDRQLALRYGQDDAEPREVRLPPVAMLDLMENQADLKYVDAVQLRPWDRAAKALRVRLRIWMRHPSDQPQP